MRPAQKNNYRWWTLQKILLLAGKKGGFGQKMTKVTKQRLKTCKFCCAELMIDLWTFIYQRVATAGRYFTCGKFLCNFFAYREVILFSPIIKCIHYIVTLDYVCLYLVENFTVRQSHSSVEEKIGIFVLSRMSNVQLRDCEMNISLIILHCSEA